MFLVEIFLALHNCLFCLYAVFINSTIFDCMYDVILSVGATALHWSMAGWMKGFISSHFSFLNFSFNQSHNIMMDSREWVSD